MRLRRADLANFHGETKPRTRKPATNGGLVSAGLEDNRKFHDVALMNFPQTEPLVKRKHRFR
jgi:hypothetical protein